MLALFNEQITREHFSANLYLQMSGWAQAKGLDGIAGFLRRHSQEEMEHMLKLFDFVSECGAQPILEATERPEPEYSSIAEVFQNIMDHEKFITTKIHELTNTALEEKDYLAFNFLQWYVSEQHEEETLFAKILEKIKILGVEGHSLHVLDGYIGRLTEAS
jgi:ferritin